MMMMMMMILENVYGAAVTRVHQFVTITVNTHHPHYEHNTNNKFYFNIVISLHLYDSGINRYN